MDQDLKTLTDQFHNEAQARYALSLDAAYRTATVEMSPTSIASLRKVALAVLGSPYLRVTNRRWPAPVVAWLVTLERGDCYAAQQERDDE